MRATGSETVEVSARFVVAALAVLLVPTTFMGAALPAVSRLTARAASVGGASGPRSPSTFLAALRERCSRASCSCHGWASCVRSACWPPPAQSWAPSRSERAGSPAMAGAWWRPSLAVACSRPRQDGAPAGGEARRGGAILRRGRRRHRGRHRAAGAGGRVSAPLHPGRVELG